MSHGTFCPSCPRRVPAPGSERGVPHFVAADAVRDCPAAECPATVVSFATYEALVQLYGTGDEA